MGRMKETAGDRPFPDTPGYKEPTSSRDAAKAMKFRASPLRERCLGQIKIRPQTADEVAAALDETVLAIRPRISELVAMRKIEATGERRPNASGQTAKIWRAKIVRA